ncbi:MAG: tetratricopeptide repeat protein, partial [Mariprofundaceae bacterium]
DMRLSLSLISLPFDVMRRSFALLFCLLLLWQPAHALSASMAEARALLDQGKDGEAASMLNALTADKPRDYQLWFMLGVAEAHQKNYQAAIRHFRKVLDLRPTLAEPHNNLAVIYNELGDLRAAVRELDASLELNPDYGTAHENIGDLYVKLALESYQKALIDEENPELQQRYQRLLHLRDARAELVTSDSTRRDAHATVGVLPEMPPQKPVLMVQKTDVQVAHAEAAGPQVMPVLEGGTRAAVLAAIEHWRAAWSARDVDGYFAAYATNFRPSGRFTTKPAWQRYKRRIIRKKSFIDVKLDAIQLSPESETKVRVDFMQYFRSDGYKSRDHKQLLLEKSQDGWKIVNEAVL